jgi:hypothetical protein
MISERVPLLQQPSSQQRRDVALASTSKRTFLSRLSECARSGSEDCRGLLCSGRHRGRRLRVRRASDWRAHPAKRSQHAPHSQHSVRPRIELARGSRFARFVHDLHTGLWLFLQRNPVEFVQGKIEVRQRCRSNVDDASSCPVRITTRWRSKADWRRERKEIHQQAIADASRWSIDCLWETLASSRRRQNRDGLDRCRGFIALQCRYLGDRRHLYL